MFANHGTNSDASASTVTHYKYELAWLVLLASKCNAYLRYYDRHRFMLSQLTVVFLQFYQGMKNACMYVLSTVQASVYISKISKLLTRAVLFIANYVRYLANTMYLLMIQCETLLSIICRELGERDVNHIYWFYSVNSQLSEINKKSLKRNLFK